MVFTKYTFLYFPSHFNMACSKWRQSEKQSMMSNERRK